MEIGRGAVAAEVQQILRRKREENVLMLERQ